jgi:hypothetical protein
MEICHRPCAWAVPDVALRVRRSQSVLGVSDRTISGEVSALEGFSP